MSGPSWNLVHIKNPGDTETDVTDLLNKLRLNLAAFNTKQTKRMTHDYVETPKPKMAGQRKLSANVLNENISLGTLKLRVI